MRATTVRQGLRPWRKRRRLPSSPLYAIVRWGGAGLFAALVIGLIVSIVSQSSQAFAQLGSGLFLVRDLEPRCRRLRGWDARRRDRHHHVGGNDHCRADRPRHLRVALRVDPAWLAGPLSTSIEFLAVVPSIVVGLWALLVLSPLFATDVEPALERLPVLGWLFHGPAYGPSVLLASVVLAIMTLPTVVALSRTALGGVPLADREAAMALGATRWQVVRRTVLPGARSGIAAAPSPWLSGARSARASRWRW